MTFVSIKPVVYDHDHLDEPYVSWSCINEYDFPFHLGSFGAGNHHIRDSEEYEIVNIDGAIRKKYGVADTVEQIYEEYKAYDDDTSPYAIFVTPVYPSMQPKSGGFRWHKWGTYIGDYDERYEYIYDEFYHGELRQHLRKHQINMVKQDCYLHLLVYSVFKLREKVVKDG